MKKGLLLLGLSAFAATALMAAEIKVGILQPLTGPIASFGQKTLDGIKLVHEKYNKLPNGDTIKLVIVDNQFDKIQTVNGYNRLASDDKVVAIEGPLASSMALSIKRFANDTKTPTVTQIATNPRVTKNTKYITRACFTDDFQGTVAAKYALKHHLNNAVVVFDMKQDYSVGLAKAFQKAYKKGGGKILKVLYINSGDKDFNAQVAQIKRLNPKFIYTPIYAPEEGLFLRQLRAAGVKAPVMGGDGIADPGLLKKLAGSAANGVMYTDHFDAAKAPTPLSAQFIKDFKAKYGRLPSAFAATGADGYLLIYNAVKQCDTNANKADLAKFKACVNNAIRHTKNLEAVTGYLTIDPNTGNPINKPAVIEKIVDGKTEFVELVKP
ncbi:ABC transporter substrate-binding protein [Caminibacter pacificus]|uniref:ABC transporter substrate-binding protein n=1 Tax=Caminibacter pacificus TaxID=1424653 RepID=A0AAJ4RBA3_9BACT|nr:ABC transporter substrate-binding protein [Caminibacter pacificus]NPA87480.1 ABC transporter substrate-binding protein [Campylobacterota bacterium]QCI27470.1 ABC transporter substrate-binding protein [Caminibacter pacificus]ROR38907.1 amino acid/amide ABC transporter substrate-binding protein (HAAT family) [Caminibacter pacificus]